MKKYYIIDALYGEEEWDAEAHSPQAIIDFLFNYEENYYTDVDESLSDHYEVEDGRIKRTVENLEEAIASSCYILQDEDGNKISASDIKDYL